MCEYIKTTTKTKVDHKPAKIGEIIVKVACYWGGWGKAIPPILRGGPRNKCYPENQYIRIQMIIVQTMITFIWAISCGSVGLLVTVCVRCSILHNIGIRTLFLYRLLLLGYIWLFGSNKLKRLYFVELDVSSLFYLVTAKTIFKIDCSPKLILFS